MGVGGRGKCPGAPSHHLKEGEDRQNGIGKGKTADRKGTVKAVWQKTGMASKKNNKKNKKNLKFAIEASGITDPNVLAMHFKTLDKKNRFTKVAGPNLFLMRPARP
jgi:hypothetical protein